MTAFQHTLKALLEGEKTETSRLVHPGEYTRTCGEMPAPWNPHGFTLLYSSVHHASSEPRFVAGKDYAIQPGRAKKQIGRYVIESIWRQDVRTLNLGQVDAESFGLWNDFWTVWIRMYDRELYDRFERNLALPGQDNYINTPKPWKDVLMQRPRERYQAWRMSIRVLWDTVDWDAPIIAALQIDPNAHIIENKFSS